MPFTPFIDITGVNSGKVPAIPQLGFVLLYATGTEGIEATAQEIARFRNAGVGVGLIDQSPSLSVFAAGIAHVAVADVESGAGSAETAAKGCLARQARNEKSTVYCSENALQEVETTFLNMHVNIDLVKYGIANYNYSRTEAEQKLVTNPHWAYVQYGDPASNPNTLVPGTSITLQEAQADIDIGNNDWLAQFLPAPTGPFRYVLAKGQTVEEFAQSRDANTLNLFHRSVPLWTATDIDLVVNGQMVVYTSHP